MAASHFGPRVFFRHTERAGVDSVPLVGLVSFFLGLTMALAYRLSIATLWHGAPRARPGCHLVSRASSALSSPASCWRRESARAFTAELGTMKFPEEVEAIEAMGIGPLRFLVAPRMLALFFLMPCLSTVSNLAAIFASSLVSRAYFSIAFVYFLDLVKDALLIRDIITGVLKSFMFGLLIGGIACYRGLTVKGGAAGVGTSTTSSVVTAITAVIGFDTLYNIVYTVFFPDMSAPPSYVVELRDVEMQFEEKKVLDGVSLQGRAAGSSRHHGPKRQRQEHDPAVDPGNSAAQCRLGFL